MRLNTNDASFTTLHNFTATLGSDLTNSDGAYPFAGLVLSGNTLYGTTSGGGSWGVGTVFSLSLPSPPQLTAIPSGVNIILSWPTNAVGFTLESTTSLLSPTEWTNEVAAPTVVGGYNVVTNSVSGPQKFYRLRL